MHSLSHIFHFDKKFIVITKIDSCEILTHKPVQNPPPPKKTGIAFEIASISDSVAKLLVLPVWATISTSVLYLMVFCIVVRFDAGESVSGVPENCIVAAEITLNCLHVGYFRFRWISTSGLHMQSREVSTIVISLNAHENVDIPVVFFHLRYA